MDPKIRTKCFLTKITSTHSNLRTDSVDGHCINFPEVGHSFEMIAVPLDPNASFRLIQTSTIKEVKWDETEGTFASCMFETENSQYELELEIEM